MCIRDSARAAAEAAARRGWRGRRGRRLGADATALGFSAADAFEGARDGAVFKMGELGLGYYTDDGPRAITTRPSGSGTPAVTSTSAGSTTALLVSRTSGGRMAAGAVVLALGSLTWVLLLGLKFRKGRVR